MKLTLWLVQEAVSDSLCPAKVAVIAGTRDQAVGWIEETLKRQYAGPNWRISGWLSLPDGGCQIKASSTKQHRAVDFRVRSTEIEAPMPVTATETRARTAPQSSFTPGPMGEPSTVPSPPSSMLDGKDEEPPWLALPL